jgi:DNA-binding winged helix-turn-helix (wHTH) protein
MGTVKSSVVRFADYTFDPATGELRRQDGTTVPLEPQPARALAVLASRAGSLVTRDELRAALWPGGVHVEFDQGLNYCIRQIRAALGDNARQPVFIETVARRGYRFLPPVDGLAPRRKRRTIIAAAAASLVAILWIAERLEGPSDGRAHHDAAVAALKALHDLIF